MKEQFLDILSRADEESIIPFLKNLTLEERKALVPVIKEQDKKFANREDRQASGGNDKVSILNTARLVCFSGKDAQKVKHWELPGIEIIDEVFEWYRPDWFFPLFEKAEYFRGRSYERIMSWQAKGYLHPSPELIVLTLPEAIERYPATFDEHIWYLFEYPSNIMWVDKGKGNWTEFFIHYAAEGRIDRMRVLRESLMAVNRNFNKNLTGWFADLFLAMEPTRDEQVALLDELFTTLSCTQTKPVGMTLTLFKKLCTEKAFKTENLMEHLPVLLSSETKAVVKSTLSLVEAILKAKPSYAKDFCPLITVAFFVKDGAIQKKTAEMIAKYQKPSQELAGLLSGYADNILMSVRPLLDGYLDFDQPVLSSNEECPMQAEPASLLQEPIREINSFEDFAFFASQALDVSEPWQFDLFVGELVRWGNQTGESDVILLEPAFQKMYKALSKWNVSPLYGLLDHLMLEYADYLLSKYPASMKNTAKLRKKFLAIDTELTSRGPYYKTRNIPISQLDVPDCLTGFKAIAIKAMDKVKKQDTVPLLSTPTHLPMWIDPQVFVRRLIRHQETGTTPENMDMQLALQRCALQETGEALKLANQSLHGEYKELMCFFLDKFPSREPTVASRMGSNGLGVCDERSERIHQAWWLSAAISRSPGVKFKEIAAFKYKHIPEEYFYGNFRWETFIEEYLAYGTFDREKDEYTRYPATRPSVRQLSPLYDTKQAKSDWLMEYLFDQPVDDIAFMLLSTPNMTDAIYKHLSIKLLQMGSYSWEVYEQNVARRAVQLLQQLHTPMREMHYLFLSACLLGNDKTVRDYAFHIWTERISAATLDSRMLGRTLGRVEIYEICPLKRLTDLMAASMLGISPLHNEGLTMLIEAMLPEMKAPIGNVKKLLEIYAELLAQTHSQAPKEVKEKLATWNDKGKRFDL